MRATKRAVCRLASVLVLAGCSGMRGVDTVLAPSFNIAELQSIVLLPRSSSAGERKLADELSYQFAELNVRSIGPSALPPQARQGGAVAADAPQARAIAKRAGVDAAGIVSIDYHRGDILALLLVLEAEGGRQLLASRLRYDAGLSLKEDHHKLAVAIVEDVKRRSLAARQPAP